MSHRHPGSRQCQSAAPWQQPFHNFVHHLLLHRHNCRRLTQASQCIPASALYCRPPDPANLQLPCGHVTQIHDAGILRYSGASTPGRLSEDKGSEAGSSHADGGALRTDFKSCQGEHSGSDTEEGVTPKALQEAMASSLLDLDSDREMQAPDRSDSMQEFLEEQKHLAAQQQQQKKAMLMELRAVCACRSHLILQCCGPRTLLAHLYTLIRGLDAVFLLSFDL